MFLFKNKKKKKSTQDLSNQDSVSNDVYVQDDHLLNIKLPDDFSSIILPQLIGYENGNTINSSTIILRQKQQQQSSIQPEEDHPTREGWYPVTRLVGSESNRGTLVDTTNITAASLVQVNKRQSASLSSTSGDTLTCHSKEDSLDESHPSLSHSEHDSFFPCMTYLQKDRPKFKRNHPRFTVLRELEKSPTDFIPRSPNSGTLKPPTPLVRPTEHIEQDSKPSGDKKKRSSREKMTSEPPLTLRPQRQQKKRASVIMPSTDDSGSMIPRRPLSCVYTEKPTTTTTTPKKTKQTRTMTINSTMGGSRIPVRSQTMKV